MKIFAAAILGAGLSLLCAPWFAQSPRAAETKKELLDINTATVAELKAIPGIGDAYSAAIVKNRPYKRKDELVDKKVLPQGVYDKIKDRIVARQK